MPGRCSAFLPGIKKPACGRLLGDWFSLFLVNLTSEYFFSAPDLLVSSYPQVYEQLSHFYRQDPLARLHQLQAGDVRYQTERQAPYDV